MKNVNIFVFLSVDRPGIGNQKRVTDWRDMDLLPGSAHKKGRVFHGKNANVTCQSLSQIYYYLMTLVRCKYLTLKNV